MMIEIQTDRCKQCFDPLFYVMNLVRNPAILVLVIFIVAPDVLANTQLRVSAALVQEGFITISWDEMDLPATHMQLSSDENFLYKIRELSVSMQQQVHLSGFEDGQYFARLVDRNGQPVSNTELFTVQHRSISAALQLFLVGLVLFVLLVAVMVRFTRN